MDRHPGTGAGRWLFFTVAATLGAGAALAQQTAPEPATGEPAAEVAAPDTTGWECKFCEFETGTRASVDLGAGYLSEDSFKFGEHTGFHEEGGFALVGGHVRWRGEAAEYFDLDVTDFAIDSEVFAPRNTLSVEGGVQGSYGLVLRYDEIPDFASDSGETPYTGTGSASLGLPGGWVTAGSTAGMSGLAAGLRGVDLDSERRRAEVGASLIANSHWDFGVNFRNETREGRRRTAGAFLFNAAQLVQPVDYVTREVEAFAGYSRERWQVRAAYLGSAFENSNPALTWENPFSPLVPGALSGELALPPDNEFHQMRLSAGYTASDATRVSGDLALGRVEQNADFLDATTNAGLGAPALPRRSLEGRVDTLNATLRVTSRLSEDLRVNARWRHDDHDNQTEQASFPWVSTDTVVATPRTNLPYSFTENALGVSADYRLAPRTRVSAGIDRETVERSNQEVDETREHSAWGKLAVRAANGASVDIRLARERRDGSSYEPVPGVEPVQNPSLRKYNLADRDRELFALQTTTLLGEGVDLGFGASVARDDYSDSPVGLTGADELVLDASLSVQLAADASAHLFVARQRIDSSQAGSSGFAGADWLANARDTVNTAGFGVERRELMDKRLDVGLDYSVTDSRGAVTVAGTAFPDLESTLHTVKLYASYRLDGGHVVQGAWWYETYESSDWALDGVEPGSAAGLLALGEEAPAYSMHALMATLRIRF